MNTTNLDRWTPLPLKHGKTLRNRIVVPPMASETGTTAGFVTPETLAHYQKLATAGAGLLIVEYTYVHPSGRSEEHQLGISSDAHIEGLAQIAQTIHKSNAIAGIQFSHGGGKSERALTGGTLMGPSSVAVPVKGQVTEASDPMNLGQIELWKNAFIAAANRAVAAGFELIELHSAHGYGLNQWLSPITNQRDDEYGGGLNARMRLLLEILNEIRKVHPQLLISVRIPGQDFLEGGLSNADAISIAKHLQNAGVDIINVSSGIGGWRRPAIRVGEGYLVSDAAQIQAVIQIPVIAVGGIETGCYIDQALNEGLFSLAAVGRAILKGPQEWNERNLYRMKGVAV